MACLADRHAAHRELELAVSDIPSVESVDFVPADRARDRWPETELVVEATRTGTLPNSVTRLFPQSSLGIHSVQTHNHPDYLYVVVR